MNRKSYYTVKDIEDAEKTYREDVNAALQHYKEKSEAIRTTATKFKDEANYIAENEKPLKEETRHLIDQAGRKYSAKLIKGADVLRAELKNALAQPLNPEFVNRLAFYKTAGIEPSRTEIETLLSLAGKHPAAIRALAKFLDDTNAPFEIECTTLETFENDISSLERLASSQILYSDLNYLSVLLRVEKEQPKLVLRGDGQLHDAGFRHDNISLTINCTSQPAVIKSLVSHLNAWAADISSRVREREAQNEQREEAEVARLTNTKYTPPQTKSTTAITERNDQGTELAREMGRADAAAREAFQAVKNRYAK